MPPPTEIFSGIAKLTRSEKWPCNVLLQGPVPPVTAAIYSHGDAGQLLNWRQKVILSESIIVPIVDQNLTGIVD